MKLTSFLVLLYRVYFNKLSLYLILSLSLYLSLFSFKQAFPFVHEQCVST